MTHLQVVASRVPLNLADFIGEYSANLGRRIQRHDIPSSLAPFNVLPDYTVTYPAVVVQALAELFREYNRAMQPLVAQNREWETDYRYAISPIGEPATLWVQIDMVGLPQSFLDAAANYDVDTVKEVLRLWIYELENSMAMYGLLNNLFPKGPFKHRFLSSLSELRHRHEKPIALLAVTHEKYAAMKADEFGKSWDEPVTGEEVKSLTGFDAFFGPDEFRGHLAANKGHCGYLVYVRSSDPTRKLRKPQAVEVDHTLLNDPDMRRIIKEHAINFAVDVPGDQSFGRRVTDTKAYMPTMGMGHLLTSEGGLFTPAFDKHIRKGRPFEQFEGGRLGAELALFLRQHCGCDPNDVDSGKIPLRFKPAVGTYGCYGHHTGQLSDKRLRGELRQDLRNRGPYIVQPELPTPTLVDVHTGDGFAYIDRVFFTAVGDQPIFMGGFRSCLPCNTTEAQRGRNHGNSDTFWALVH